MRKTGGRTVLLLALAAGAIFAAGCIPAASESGPTIWACGESLKVGPELAPQASNSVWNEPAGQIRLYGARQEYVGFQVIVRSGAAPLSSVRVNVGPLRSSGGRELPATDVDLFREHYLRVTVPSQYDNQTPVPEARAGEFPVQMVPLRSGADTFPVTAERNQPVWVDLYVPEDQPPGEYRGSVEVTEDGKSLRALQLQLTVWPITLPRQTHLKTFLATGPEQLRWAFGLKDGDDDALRSLEDRFFQMAHQHRLNFLPSAGDDVEKEWGERFRGYLNGSAFRERAGKGVGQNLLVIGAGGDTEPEVTAHVKSALAWWKREHFSAQLACYVYDEPESDEDFAAATQRAGWIRAAAGKELPLFLTTPHPEKMPTSSIDIWGELPAKEIAPRQAAGQQVWAVNQGYAGGPYVDTPGYAGRSQGWMAWKLKLAAFQFWDACYWVDRQNIRNADGKKLPYRAINAAPAQFLTDTWSNPLTFDQKRNPREKDWNRINGDGVLFYPGTPAGLQEPLASFTMKSLRRGLQDYEYLWLLNQAGKPADDVVAKLVPAPGQWNHDPDAWDAARLELGRRLAADG